MLLVCINRNAYAHDSFITNGVLCVNVLGNSHQDLSRSFARWTGEDRFAAAQWSRLVTGAPVLAGAAVAFDCRIAEAQQRRAMRAEIDHAATGPHAADLELFGDRDAQADAWVRAGFTPVEAGAWLCAGVLDAGVASHLRSIEVMACSPLLRDELHHGATWGRALSVTREMSVADFEVAWREA